MLYRQLAEFNFTSLIRSMLGIEYWFWYDERSSLELLSDERVPSVVLPGQTATVLTTTRIGPGNLELLYKNVNGLLRGNTTSFNISQVLEQGGWLDAISVHK